MFFSLIEIVAHREFSNDLTQFGLVLFVCLKKKKMQCFPFTLLRIQRNHRVSFVLSCNLTSFLEDSLKSTVLSKLGVPGPKNA